MGGAHLHACTQPSSSISVSQQPPICEHPSHSSMISSQWATQVKEKIISLMFPEAAGGNLELSAVAGGLTDVSHTRLLLC